MKCIKKFTTFLLFLFTSNYPAEPYLYGLGKN
jgi:hypothetical protein